MHRDIYLEVSDDLHFPVDRRSVPVLIDNADALGSPLPAGLAWIGVEELEPTRIEGAEIPGIETIIPGRYHATCYGGYRLGQGCFYVELPGEIGKGRAVWTA